MNSETTQSRVEEIIATLFNVPIETINLKSSPQTIENWDSMGHLMLILELEQQFGVQLAPEEVETLISVSSIVELLQARG